MKTLLGLIREPIIIGAFVFALLIVIAAYVGSHYYYSRGEIEILALEDMVVAPSQPPSQTSLELDLGELSDESNNTPTQLESEITPPDGISIEEFMAELSEEEKQDLASEIVDELPRESIHGFGPYPNIPSDYPRQNIWDELERLDDVAGSELGRSSRGHELMHRVLIKLWNQGRKAEGASIDDSNGRVYPMYNDTVYVSWREDENDDGSVDRYIGRYTCHPSLRDYRDSVENSTHPSWLKVVRHDEGGIDPYSFLDLP